MGTHFLATERIIEIDQAHYQAEIALKAAILATDPEYYVQTPPATEAMAWEALALLLPNMARHFPDACTLVVDGDRWRWTNRRLCQETVFTIGDAASLPRTPLDWLGRQVQEDLLLLDGTAEGTPLVAGHLCFAAGWCLDDKLGRSFLAIHDPVPAFHERIGRPADLLMQRLKPGRPVERIGWSLTVSDQLDRSPRATRDLAPLHAAITPTNAGQRVYLRLERQTLSRLPVTQAVLFTIHTSLAPLDAVLTDTDRLARFATTIATLPPATAAYKGIVPYQAALLTYLDERGRTLATDAQPPSVTPSRRPRL
jgi:hypothetical protein